MMRGNFSPTGAGRRHVAWCTILALAGCFPLAACGPQVIGQPKPPPEFGARKTKLVGCPSVEGLYAWPPVDGEYAKGMATNIQPWNGGRPVPVSRARMQIKVEQTGSRITMRSLSIDPPRRENAGASLDSCRIRQCAVQMQGRHAGVRGGRVRRHFQLGQQTCAAQLHPGAAGGRLTSGWHQDHHDRWRRLYFLL